MTGGAVAAPAVTIAAVATGSGGGIGIVRVSGPGAAAIGARLLRGLPAAPESRKLYVCSVVDSTEGGGREELVDVVLATVMWGPRSYTGEDVLEIHGHGGGANLRRILELVLAAGARLAEPGEFTRRAFLHGRIDLSQAEAVGEVIAARSARGLRLAQAQLGGAIGRRVRELRRRVIELVAEVEAQIDFPEEDLAFAVAAELGAVGLGLGDEVGELAATYGRGRLIQGGLEVVLAGRPNAGKSSLLNALLGAERALVDPEPGTTRDLVEGTMELGGLAVRFVDTAGERGGEGSLPGRLIEQRGMELGRRRRAQADLILLVVDGAVGFGAVEEELFRSAPGRVVVVWNKRDLAPDPWGIPVAASVVTTAATDGQGLDQLRRAILEAAGDSDESEAGAVVTSARQQGLLVEAAAALRRGGDLLARGEPMELVAVELRLALDRLGGVTGEGVGEAVLEAIFARFCIGK